MTIPDILDRLESIRSIAGATRPGVVLDFDGTLSEIAQTPAAARIHPRCAEALKALVGHYPLIAVLSGRTVDDLAAKVGIPGIVYVGNHGAEHLVDGVTEGVRRADENVIRLVDHLSERVRVPGLFYEPKGLSASVHLRGVDDPADAESRLMAALVGAPGADQVELFWGRMVLEIRPATAINKGDAVANLISKHNLDAVAFVGDDTTDVDAMKRLSTYAELPSIRVAVLSPETPSALLSAADHTIAGVPQVAELIERLVAQHH